MTSDTGNGTRGDAIIFDNVSYTISGHRVLEDVSFTVKPGQTTVIMGPSGIGKSTVLRLLLGLVRPNRGDIFICGKSIVRASEGQRNMLRSRIGMVFQNGALFDSLTVGENVAYGAVEHGHQTLDEFEPQARHFLKLVGLDDDFVLDRLPDQLSVGMQRRVAIARAIAFNEPEVMLYDEPTTGLDPISVELVIDVILRLRRELGVTSVIVTHEIAHALKVADCFLFLYDRRVAFEGSQQELARSRVGPLVSFLEPFKSSLHQAVQSFSDEDETQ